MNVIDRETLRDGLAAGSVAAIVSGAPRPRARARSRTDPLEASLAAAALVLPCERRRGLLLAAAAPVHIILSLFWALMSAIALPRRRTPASGLGVAALYLGLVGASGSSAAAAGGSVRCRRRPSWPTT